MPLSLTNTSHFDFFEQLEEYATDAAEMLKNSHGEQTEIKRFKVSVDGLIATVKRYIGAHIEPGPEEILSMLSVHYDKYMDRDFSLYGFIRQSEMEKEIERLNKFLNRLRMTIRYLFVVDTLVDKQHQHKMETVEDKSDFLLLKLNELADNSYYAASLIFSLNDIPFRNGEPTEIVELLQKKGYLIRYERHLDASYAKISVKGASYIERKNKRRKSNQAKNELDKKIANIFEHLTKLGYGQEIIFNEIDELRKLQHKLSKKSWSQLLKGKLLDLALDKLIDTETATSIYGYLTGNGSNLLKQ